MKKVYLFFALAVLGSITVNAQMAQERIHTGKTKTLSSTVSSSVIRQGNPTGVNHSSTLILADDFSTPGTWVISHAAGTIGDWVIGPNPPAGLGPIDPINSGSAINGFARFDSDSICSHDQIGNITSASSINLSAYAGIRFSFSQYYRRFHDSTYVIISTDNINWTRFPVNGNLAAGQFSANNAATNPDIVTIDISSVAAGQATVWYGFQFYSPDTNGAGADTLAGCGYSWMVDDVTISDIPSVDAGLAKAYAGEYSIIPIIQPEGFKLRGKIINTGSSAFSGAKIMFNVFDINGLVYLDSSAATGTINPGDSSALLTSIGTYAPLATGFYLVEQLVSLAGDGNAANDTALADILVSDSTYARDLTAIGGNTLVGGGYGFNGNTGSMGEIFRIDHPSEFTSATIFLRNPTAGNHLSISVYNVSGATGLPTTLVATSPAYTITAADTVLRNIAFSAPVTTVVGDYFVCINQLDTTNVTIGASTEIYTFHKGYYKSATGLTWTPFETSLIPYALVLRVNNPSGTLAGVQDVKEQSSFSVFPNPTSGIFYVSGNGVFQKDVTVTVVNSVGQVVRTIQFNSLTVNRVDLSDLAKGLYTMQIQSATGKTNKSILIN